MREADPIGVAEQQHRHSKSWFTVVPGASGPPAAFKKIFSYHILISYLGEVRGYNPLPFDLRPYLDLIPTPSFSRNNFQASPVLQLVWLRASTPFFFFLSARSW